MTSASFVPEAGCGPNSTTAPDRNTQTQAQIREAHNTNARNNNSPSSSDSHPLHTHRQNHNSSKLPAFRFADLKRDHISLPSLLQHIAPSPVSSQESPDIPDQNQQQQNAQEQSRRIPGPSRDSLHHSKSAKALLEKPSTFEAQQSPAPFSRSRSLKVPLPSKTAPSADPSTGSKRPASVPDAPRDIGSVYATRSQLSYVATPVTKRRLTASAIAQNTTPAPPRSQPKSGRQRGSETSQTDDATPITESPPEELAQGQREPSLPKPGDAAKSEDKRARPPTSSKSTHKSNPSTGRAIIPPIRGFRSSGSRKSVVLDMHTRRASEESLGEGVTDPKQRDRALRALEGRDDEDFLHLAPAESGELTTATDNDNTADIFMKIAREATPPRAPESQAPSATPSVISRIIRTSHRRPLSAAIPAHQAPSPPQILRRLSDQRESSRSRAESVSAQQKTKEFSSRAASRENPAPIITASDGPSRTQSARTPLRPSPITPRSISFKDSFAESSSAYQRRRQSLTENNNASSTRTTPYRSYNLAPSQTRTYHSSPLVPKSPNIQREDSHGSDLNPGVEGTESSNSTAAPSTVWDELDDLKSRIHRLELTGKMPPVSGVAMSRVSDDRPRTATTNATTMSASPKRIPTHDDGNDNVLLPRESHPLLLSALRKTKGLVSSDVYKAVESTAREALTLASMVGACGESGPISSAASAIGYGGSVTDRQLRRRADGICRNLTELCLALADEADRHKEAQPAATTYENELLSPTSPESATTAIQRRPSAIAEMVTKPEKSPRAPTALEKRRQSMLAGTTGPSSSYTTVPATPLEPMSTGRKSSLLLARIRRSGTEEPEETPGRRSSLLFRSRRGGTEEPEENHEGRKSSFLLRSRRTMNDEDDEPRVRAPSRAVTEVNGFRGASREYPSAAQSPPENTPLSSFALPRRRFIPSSLTPRLLTSNSALSSAAPSPATPARRYLDRPTPLSEPLNSSHSYYTSHTPMADKFNTPTPDERSSLPQRQLSLTQTALLNRSGSLGRRHRESGIPSYSSSPAHQQQYQDQYQHTPSRGENGGYR